MREPVTARIVLPEAPSSAPVVRLSEADIERIAVAVLSKIQPLLGGVSATPQTEAPDAYFPIKRNPPTRATSEY